jgi:pimeloyl-ACP methyl ester carboxylesterase
MAIENINLHGHRVSYRRDGESEGVILLVHGLTSSSGTWQDVFPLLADRHTVLAPDLPGHGASANPSGDYSLGAYASCLRDLMVALGHDRATIVGHSLGGGIVMQFAYQFPEFIERMVLVSSGGLGREVNIFLRAMTLPGAEYVLPVLTSNAVLNAGGSIGAFLGRLGLRARPDIDELWKGFSSLGDAGARAAFVHTLRGIVEPGGQRVSASDRLYLAEAIPTLLVWGEQDPVIPVAHGRGAHEQIPHSRFDMIEGAGHFPHRDEPLRFARTLIDFIDANEPATPDWERLRELLRKHE